MIERVTRPGDRRDYFQINEAPGLLQRIVDRYRARQAMAEEMKHVLGRDPESGTVVRTAWENLIRFYSILADSLNAVVAAVEEARDAPRSLTWRSTHPTAA